MIERRCQYRVYLWEIPVRLNHWVNVLCIITLSVTGYLIGSPRIVAATTADFVMGWIRFIHFTAAYLFTVSVISRIIWSLIGNRYAGWMEFFPLATAKGRKNFVKMLRYYFLIDKERNVDEGLELIEKALVSSPDNYDLLNTKGWGLYKQGKYKDALEILQKSWDLRMANAVYDHDAFLHLDEAKKAVAQNK